MPRIPTLSVLALAALLAAASPAAAAPPPNDAFTTPAVLVGETATATAQNGEATKEAGEPNHAGNFGGHSVWWRWKAPADAGVTAETCGSTFDTLLGVYTGDVISALTTVAANDDAGCGGGHSSVTFVATAGTTYWIAVDGRDDRTGDIALSLVPTIRVQATRLLRRHAVDATRFVIDVSRAGEPEPELPSLVLTRNGKAEDIDLELVEGSMSDTHFTYAFRWNCERRGSWKWAVSARRDGTAVSREGAFKVPGCVTKPWFVTRARVRRGVAGDFGKSALRRTACDPLGRRKGSRAARWRCTQTRAGRVCRGSFSYRFTQTFQDGELVARRRTPSGAVNCRR